MIPCILLCVLVANLLRVLHNADERHKRLNKEKAPNGPSQVTLDLMILYHYSLHSYSDVYPRVGVFTYVRYVQYIYLGEAMTYISLYSHYIVSYVY